MTSIYRGLYRDNSVSLDDDLRALYSQAEEESTEDNISGRGCAFARCAFARGVMSTLNYIRGYGLYPYLSELDERSGGCLQALQRLSRRSEESRVI